MKTFVPFTFLLLCSLASSAQCVIEKNDSLDLDHLDDADTQWVNLESLYPRWIRSDSVLLLYITNPDNHTYYGRQCCYSLAAEFAETEMNGILSALKDTLLPEDWELLKASQQQWTEFYEAEFKFTANAFMTYSNFDRYGLGRESSVSTISGKYYMIRRRMMDLRSYYDTLVHH